MEQGEVHWRQVDCVTQSLRYCLDCLWWLSVGVVEQDCGWAVLVDCCTLGNGEGGSGNLV